MSLSQLFDSANVCPFLGVGELSKFHLNCLWHHFESYQKLSFVCSQSGSSNDAFTCLELETEQLVDVLSQFYYFLRIHFQGIPLTTCLLTSLRRCAYTMNLTEHTPLENLGLEVLFQQPVFFSINDQITSLSIDKVVFKVINLYPTYRSPGLLHKWLITFKTFYNPTSHYN